MANIPHPKRDQILTDLLANVPPKVIAATHDVAYATVISIKDRCFDVLLKLKRNIPDPRQLNFRFGKIEDD